MTPILETPCDPPSTGEVAPAVEDPIPLLVGRFAGLYGLSSHQTAVLAFAAGGLCRKESARRLSCSLKTVDEHWRRVYAKTRCSSELEVLAKLLRLAMTARP